MTRIILLPAFVILILVATYLHFRRTDRIAPDHHPRVVRILCAVLFVSALLAVGVGTWRECFGTKPIPEITVNVPTRKPRPIPPSGQSNNHAIDIGPCRLIATVILVGRQGEKLIALRGEDHWFEWPAESDMTFRGDYGGASYRITMDLRGFLSLGKDGPIQATHDYRVVTQGPNWSSSGGGNFMLDSIKTTDFGNGSDPLQAPLSLIPAGSPDLYLLVQLTRADSDDPLESISANQWLARNAADIHLEKPRNRIPGTTGSPGARMLTFLGPSALVLLIAAVAGANVFRRGSRWLAFAGLLGLMVIFAGSVDGVVTNHRAGIAADDALPESTRELALTELYDGTFFHTGTALSRIREIASNRSNPDSLRKLAGAIAGPANEIP